MSCAKSQVRACTVIALLSSTSTTRTVGGVVEYERHEILVHALTCDDAQAMIDDMKTRYEAPLLQIFRQQPRAAAPGAGATTGRAA